MSLCKITSSYICIVEDSIRYSFKKFMKLYLFVCVCMCSTCMSTPREVKEQLMGVCSLFLPCKAWDWNSGSQA